MVLEFDANAGAMLSCARALAGVRVLSTYMIPPSAAQLPLPPDAMQLTLEAARGECFHRTRTRAGVVEAAAGARVSAVLSCWAVRRIFC